MNLSLIPLPQSKERTKRVTTRSPFGIQPEFQFDYSASKGISRRRLDPWLIEGFEHQQIDVGLWKLASHAGRALTAIETDWVNLAMAIYAADRFAARRPGRSAGDTSWCRSISLSVSVVDHMLWENAKPLILSALSFLTDDRWSLQFSERSLLLEEERQRHLIPNFQEEPPWVCLFSGGLDSLAGIKRLSSLSDSHGVMVSGWTHERLRVGQADIVDEIRSSQGKPFHWLPIYYGFPKIKNDGGMESSQRSRGWVHVALGLAAAFASQQDTLDVCENGIGAFNLPTELSQTGSHTSRAMHPVFLHRIAQAASVVFGRDFKVRQSAVFETKGELLAQTLSPSEAKLAAKTFSCEIFPNYRAKQSECGVCPSCLVRRASLHAAGIGDSGHLYALDVLTQDIPPRKALGLIKMERYVRRISHCFGPSASDDSAMWEYPEAGSYFVEAAKSLDLSLDDYLCSLRKTHHSFVLEWRNFVATLPALRRAA
jgi:hypothetical protein